MDATALVGDELENPGGGGSHGDDTLGAIDHLRRLLAYLEVLFVHDVSLDLLGLHRGNVPYPTWRVTVATGMPSPRISSRTVSVKCSPAVGAATDPGCLA